MDQRSTMPDSCAATAPGAPAAFRERAGFRLVGNAALMLDYGAQGAPADWHEAIVTLLAGHGIAHAPAPSGVPRAGSGLRQAMRLVTSGITGGVTGAGQGDAAPVFAPWQGFAPAALQNPLARAALPQAQWLASWLFDPAAPRVGASGTLDIMLVSPHPAACLEDEACHTALPRRAVLDAMIAAVRSEGREKLAMIVPAHARSAMTQQVLAANRALMRGDMALEVVATEDALARLVRSPECWDAIIVLPEWRGIVAAVLAEMTGVTAPLPMMWCDRTGVRFASETLREAPSPLALDAAVLIQSLALAARQQGMGYEARRLAESWVRLRDGGAATPARASLAPYGQQLDEAAFIALASSPHPNRAAGRAVPGWRALDGDRGNQRPRSPVALSVVSS